jgi:predicted phosphodiesterase
MNASSFDAIWCLGDVVGYGPDPNRCIERLQDYESLLYVAGNHDWAAVGRADLHVFNYEARMALLWTQEKLLPESSAFLSSKTSSLTAEGFLLVHASPRKPIWEYVLGPERATGNFIEEDFSIAIVGHTHVPRIFEWLDESQEARMLLPDWEEPMNLEGRRLILNPGSVGQPRDGNPRAAYALLDTEAMTWEARRVRYSVTITQERMRARGLPQRLIDRLEMGR